MVTTATSGTRMPSCGLMIAAMTVQIGGTLGPVAPQLAQAEQHEDDAEGVDLAPDDAVEPADRVHDRDEGAPARARRSRPPSSRTIDQTSQPIARSAMIGGTLISSTLTPPSDLADDPDQPQHVHVAGRVVVEEVAVVEAQRPVRRELARPESEGSQVVVKSGPGEQVCDDEPKGEPEREDDQDRADGSLRPGRPRRRCCASLGPTGCGASHRERLLHERGRWI